MKIMRKFKTTALVVSVLGAASILTPFQAAIAAEAAGPTWNVSGWINESATYYDDGSSSDLVNSGDNGTTLGSRINFSGSTPLAGTGLSAGFEIIIEPTSFGNGDPLTSPSQADFENSNDFGKSINLLSSNIHLSGVFGKVTLGTQSMPTDNIAVLADPSMTIWSSVSAVFRGNGFDIQGLAPGTQGVAPGAGPKWGNFLQCLGVPGLGIGIDCNGIYRNGIRYDLPAFGPVSVAFGYANDDVYDVAVRYSGTVMGLTANLNAGYSYNANGGSNVAGVDASGNSTTGGSDTYQIQAGLMDPGTGLFGVIAYQTEKSDHAIAGSGHDTDSWWAKGGIKKNWFGFGDTAVSANYGQYNDQYGTLAGVTGSEVQRYGVSVDQYFGSDLIIYALYRQLSLDVDGPAAASYSGADDLDTFTLGLTFFFSQL